MSSVHKSIEQALNRSTHHRDALRSSSAVLLGRRRLFLSGSAAAVGALLTPTEWNGSILDAQDDSSAAAMPQLFSAARELETQIVILLQTPGALEAHLGVEQLDEEDAEYLRQQFADGLAILGHIPRLTLVDRVDLQRFNRRTFTIARRIAERVRQINPSIEDPLRQPFNVHITLFGVLNLVPWWVNLLTLLALGAFAFTFWLSTSGDVQRAIAQSLNRLLDVAGGRIPDRHLGDFVHELAEQARDTLDIDKEMALREGTIRRLEEEFGMTPPGGLRRRLGILLRELRVQGVNVQEAPTQQQQEGLRDLRERLTALNRKLDEALQQIEAGRLNQASDTLQEATALKLRLFTRTPAFSEVKVFGITVAVWVTWVESFDASLRVAGLNLGGGGNTERAKEAIRSAKASKKSIEDQLPRD